MDRDSREDPYQFLSEIIPGLLGILTNSVSNLGENLKLVSLFLWE